MPDEPTSEDLRRQELEQTTTEHEAIQPEEAAAARRRAEKASYLADRLEEAERSER